MRNRLSCCTSILLFCLCTSATAQSQLTKLYLNPKTVAREKQSKYIDSIRFIPLEIKEGSDFSTDYSSFITKNFILLINQTDQKITLYTRQGHFIKNINYKMLGANFYPNYNEFSNSITFFGPNKNYRLTPKDQIKIKMDWDNPRNKKYFNKYTLNLSDTSLTIKKDIPEEKDITGVYPYYGNYFIQGEITTSSLYKDSLDYELKIYQNNQLVKHYFPYNRVNEARYRFTQEHVSFSRTDTTSISLVTRPFCDTIYRMVKDSLFPAFQLVWPLENSLPTSFFTKPFKNKTERENFYRNNGWMLHQLYGFYETPKFIFFLVSYLSNYDSYVYEKDTNIAYKTKNIKPDSGQFNLELLGNWSSQRMGNRFYQAQKAADLLAFFNKNKNVPIPNELEAFLKSNPSDSNPVIVEYKLKN